MARLTQTVCDRCNAVLAADEYIVLKISSGNSVSVADLCAGCATDVRNSVSGLRSQQKRGRKSSK